MTVQDLINSAMSTTGELRHGQEPNPEESATALGVLNALLGEMSTQHKAVYIIDQKQFQLTSGKACYTMGPSASADFNTERPVKIQSAGVIYGDPQAGLRKNLKLVSSKEFAILMEKSMQALQPIVLYNDNDYPLIKMCLWPVPQ
jgi:hypothetical protein